MEEPLRIGLWHDAERQNYGRSKPIEIGGTLYWVNLYKNDRKTEDRHPDLNLVLRPAGAAPVKGDDNGSIGW